MHTLFQVRRMALILTLSDRHGQSGTQLLAQFVVGLARLHSRRTEHDKSVS